MTHFISRDKLKKLLTVIAAALFWIAVWQLAYIKVAQELLLVSPAQAFTRLITSAANPLFISSVLSTCLRVVSGFLLALSAGTLLAALSARFKIISALISPLFGVVSATPVASFIILATLWISTDRLPVFIAFLMVVPMVWSNIFAGIKAADKNLLEMAKIFKLPRGKIFSAIYVPSVMPFFVSACSVGLGFAWKSAIAAEVICLPKLAVGRQIHNSKVYLETADLFAWTIAVIILSLTLEKLVFSTLKRLSKRLYAANSKEPADA